VDGWPDRVILSLTRKTADARAEQPYRKLRRMKRSRHVAAGYGVDTGDASTVFWMERLSSPGPSFVEDKVQQGSPDGSTSPKREAAAGAASTLCTRSAPPQARAAVREQCANRGREAETARGRIVQSCSQLTARNAPTLHCAALVLAAGRGDLRGWQTQRRRGAGQRLAARRPQQQQQRQRPRQTKKRRCDAAAVLAARYM
jgi:hypothetical protein